MKDIKVPFLPRIGFNEGKEIAENFLKKNNFWGKRLPTNIEILALKTNHPVVPLSDLRNRFDCKGTAWFNKKEDRLEIYIDFDHYQNQNKSSQFTIAEELAHIIVHAQIFEQVENLDDRLALDHNTTESTHRVIEKQAKHIASELLLPTDLFNPFVDEWLGYNLKDILSERPANESDLISIISRRLGDKLELSHYIIERALTRQFDKILISELAKKHKIKYLEDIPPKKISDSN